MLSMAPGVNQTLVGEVVRAVPVLGDDVVDLDGLSGDEPAAAQGAHIVMTVTCWEGQSRHLQVTASAFFASRPGRPSVLGTVDLGASSFGSVTAVRWSRNGERGEVNTKAG